MTELVNHAVDGDATAWNHIVDRMENMVWSVVRSFRLSDSDSQDAAQIIWLRVVENLHKIRDPDRLGLWIATTARRECLRLIEKRNRSVPIDHEVGFAHLAAPIDIQIEQADRAAAQRILDALWTLGERCHALLRLVLCDPPMNYAEIAEVLGIAIGTIGARRQRCLSKLRAAANC